MVWSLFKNIYLPSRGVAWVAWQPTCLLRAASEAADSEKVDLASSAKKFCVPDAIRNVLDRIITPELYTYLLGAEINNNFLKENGFALLHNASTRVLEHVELKGWLIKISKDETRHIPMMQGIQQSGHENRMSLRNLNLLRAAGRDYFVQKLENLSQEEKKIFDFPEEYLYASPHAPQTANNHQKYFSISEKKDVYSGSETIEKIKNLDKQVQKAIAQKIISLVKQTRMHDLHKENLRLSKNTASFCFEMIDSEPTGIFVDNEDCCRGVFDTNQHVLLGLINFRDLYCRPNGLTLMAHAADKAIVDYLNHNASLQEHIQRTESIVDPTPATLCDYVRLSVLIILSIICPFIPLIFLIGSVISKYCCPSQYPNDPCNNWTVDWDTPGHGFFSVS